MDFNCHKDYSSLLAPMDWENQTPVDDSINNKSPFKDTDEEVENEEACQKWLLWLNSDTFWKIPEMPDIMVEIFSRVPPKSLIRLKRISKNFLDFTGQNYFISKQFDNTSVSGFFGPKSCSHNIVNPDDFDWIQYKNLKSEFYSLQDPELKFILPRDKGYMVRLIDCCNGFLLCINIKTNPSSISTSGDMVTSPKRKKKTKPDKTCFVCNPFTKEKVALPHYHRRSTRVNHALMADLDGKGYVKYKVVCLLRDKIHDSGTELLIFSSETGEWEEQRVDFPIMHHPSMMGSKVFFNGSLFWDCFETHILVCHLDKKKSGCCFELIEAPCASVGRCLWKFHEKLLCYCHSYEGDFPAWSLSINEISILEWKIEGCQMFETMSREISIMNLENLLISPKVRNFPQVRFKIIAHDPVLNMVYFCLKDVIYSYRLKNREVSLVAKFDNYCCYCRREPNWRQKFESMTCVLAYKHSLARIQTGEAREEEREKKSDNKEKDRLPESLVEKEDELVSVYEDCANKIKPKRRKGKKVKHKGNGNEGSEDQEDVEFLKSMEKDNDEFASSSCECEDSANKVGSRQRKAKRINFSLLRLDEE